MTGGGGFIPARILRTFLRKQSGKSIPIQAIGLTLYEQDDVSFDPANRPVRKTQWLTYNHQHGPQEAAVSLQGHRILIVDEVSTADDNHVSRVLCCCQRDVRKGQIQEVLMH